VGAAADRFQHVLGYSLSGWALLLGPLVPLVGVAVALLLRRQGPVVRVLAGCFAGSCAAILLITLTPGRTPGFSAHSCSLVLTGLSSDAWSRDARTLNILIFVPVGFFAATLVRASKWPLVLAFGLSFAVELSQREIASIHRSCDVIDVVDNTLGALIGAAVGLLVVWVVARFPPD
jgi:VanZ like family